MNLIGYNDLGGLGNGGEGIGLYAKGGKERQHLRHAVFRLESVGR